MSGYDNKTLPAILPLPVAATQLDSGCPLTRTTRLSFARIEDARVLSYAEQLLGDLPLGEVVFDLAQAGDTQPELHVDESYDLLVEEHVIRITANSCWGALHGITTLWQLQQTGDLERCGWRIEDAPRFPWRGLLIDVARHFLSVDLLRSVIDGMALLKLNVLHLHLSDDQGFRMACNAFPELASEQHYSPAELQQLVHYAADRGIRVVPEIDVPGHVNSWLTAHPEWGLNPVESTTRFGVHKACLDVTNESVYSALDSLFDEVVQIFPDAYVHIGGDEVHPAWWRESERVQQFIEQHQLVDERGLQAYFNRRMVDMLAAKNRKVVGWDEVLHPQMPMVLVQNWRGATTRDRALAGGQDCLISAGYYLDLFYPADLHYGYDPQASQAQLIEFENALAEDMRLAHVSEGIGWTHQWRAEIIDIAEQPEEIRAAVLGGEACLWAELVDEHTLPMRLWSRLPAVAERLWSERDVCDVEDFYDRLSGFLQLSVLGLEVLLRRQLTSVGLSSAQIDVVKMLEPVKWYARLLGAQALQARLMGKEMPQARPYGTLSSFDRVVDYISPESLVARDLADCNEDELSAHLQSWRQAANLKWPEDVAPVISRLAEVANCMQKYLEGTLSRQQLELDLQDAYQPLGEYMLAPVPSLLVWLQRQKEQVL
ncbi:MAG: beta-N-acetylhexosaminidase [Pseudomonadaceae bacterium]|nr:beta-N-acetylhexosaminidase [Pseudomonadaceae bacterium]